VTDQCFDVGQGRCDSSEYDGEKDEYWLSIKMSFGDPVVVQVLGVREGLGCS